MKYTIELDLDQVRDIVRTDLNEYYKSYVKYGQLEDPEVHAEYSEVWEE